MDIYMLLSAEEQMVPRLFGLDLQLLFDSGLTLLAVFVLFLVLSYNLFNPARKILAERRMKIANDINDALADRELAAKLKEEYEAKIREVDKEAEQILADARKKALANENRILQDARKEADAIIRRANSEAEQEKRRVKDEVKQEMISIASLMAKKAVSDSIDIKVQESLLEDTLKEIGNDTWRS